MRWSSGYFGVRGVKEAGGTRLEGGRPGRRGGRYLVGNAESKSHLVIPPKRNTTRTRISRLTRNLKRIVPRYKPQRHYNW